MSRNCCLKRVSNYWAEFKPGSKSGLEPRHAQKSYIGWFWHCWRNWKIQQWHYWPTFLQSLNEQELSCSSFFPGNEFATAPTTPYCITPAQLPMLLVWPQRAFEFESPVLSHNPDIESGFTKTKCSDRMKWEFLEENMGFWGDSVGKESARGGHDSPLQYPFPENPMDRGAQPATVHGVATSWTRLKQLRMHAHSWPSLSACPSV